MSKTKSNILISLAPLILCVTTFTLANLASATEVSYLGAIKENLHAPTALFVSSDVLAVLEPYSKEMKIFTPDGQMQERLQISGWVTGLNRLRDGVYVFCDREKRQIVIFDTYLQQQSSLLSSNSSIDPTDLLLTSKGLYVLDANARSLNNYTVEGILLSSETLRNNSGNLIGFPSALAYDYMMDRYFVLDQTTSEIWILDASGTFMSKFSSYGGAPGEITRGGALRCDSQGLLYISDRYQGRVVVFNTFGEFVTNIELKDFGEERLSTPIGLALDESNILYVASTESASIHMFQISGYSGSDSYMSLNQLLPEHRDTLSADALTLKAESFAKAELLLDASVEFELHDAANTSSAPINVTSIKLTDSLVGEAGSALVEWKPDVTLQPGESYQWRTRLISAQTTGPWSAMREFTISVLPLYFSLEQNYPNPFNPSTRIDFTLAHDSHVKLIVINLLGQKVVTLLDEKLSAGVNTVIWEGLNSNGVEVATGVYFYRMQAPEYVATKKMVMVK